MNKSCKAKSGATPSRQRGNPSMSSDVPRNPSIPRAAPTVFAGVRRRSSASLALLRFVHSRERTLHWMPRHWPKRSRTPFHTPLASTWAMCPSLPHSGWMHLRSRPFPSVCARCGRRSAGVCIYAGDSVLYLPSPPMGAATSGRSLAHAHLGLAPSRGHGSARPTVVGCRLFSLHRSARIHVPATVSWQGRYQLLSSLDSYVPHVRSFRLRCLAISTTS